MECGNTVGLNVTFGAGKKSGGDQLWARYGLDSWRRRARRSRFCAIPLRLNIYGFKP
jgi:hypothetical protein